MKRAKWLLICTISLFFIALYSSDALALAEAGLGFVLPAGGGSALGQIVLAPNAAISPGFLGLSLDAWFSPGNDVFYLFPYLTLNLPLPLAKVYGGIGPKIWGSSAGINLMPPFLELFVKVGGTFYGLPVIAAYGEVVATIVPLQGSISEITLVIGARVGF